MRQIVIPIIAILSAVLAAQAAEPYSDCDSVRFEDFRHIDLNDFEPTTYPYSFYSPGRLTIINDSIIAYDDSGTSPLIKVLNINSEECLAYINTGSGKYEMSSINYLSYNDSVLSVFCGRSNNFAQLRQKSDLEFYPVDWMTTIDEIWRIVQTDSAHYIWSGRAHSDNQFHKIDIANDVTTSFGEFPLVPHDDNVMPDETIMQCNIDFSSETRRLAAVLLDWDIISIYDADNLQLIRRIRGPLFIDRRVAVAKHNDGTMVKCVAPYLNGTSNGVKPSKSGFSIGLCGTDEMIGEFYPRITTIASYSWDGDPLQLIQLPEPTIAFDYDLDRNLLFLMTVDDDGIIRLKKYDLKKQQS